MNIALYFGSFNPIHNAHLAIAQYILGNNMCDEVWFVVSPQNPLKDKRILASEYHRLAMARLAIEQSEFPDRIKASDIEFSLQKPSYTYITLEVLRNKYPNDIFTLVMGEDNLEVFDKWKNWEKIIKNHKIFVYPRGNSKKNNIFADRNVVLLTDAPLFDLSSTKLRSNIENNTLIEEYTPKCVLDYIKENNLYE